MTASEHFLISCIITYQFSLNVERRADVLQWKSVGIWIILKRIRRQGRWGMDVRGLLIVRAILKSSCLVKLIKQIRLQVGGFFVEKWICWKVVLRNYFVWWKPLKKRVCFLLGRYHCVNTLLLLCYLFHLTIVHCKYIM